MILLVLMQLTPALPDAQVVFDDPKIPMEIRERCAPTGLPDQCRAAINADVARLRSAYASAATTPEQQLKMLTVIDDARRMPAVDWTGIASRYFAWRAIANGDVAREWAKARSSQRSTTIETQCFSYGGRYYSSMRCTTSQQ